jgi:hypothetical protein
MKIQSFLFPALLLLLATFTFSSAAQMQNNAILPGSGWQVINADWGAGNRRIDVTNRVRVMLSGNGMVQVTNQNLGGDPAVGADKVLRINARNSSGQSRQFTFKEGSAIDASQFYNYVAALILACPVPVVPAGKSCKRIGAPEIAASMSPTASAKCYPAMAR